MKENQVWPRKKNVPCSLVCSARRTHFRWRHTALRCEVEIQVLRTLAISGVRLVGALNVNVTAAVFLRV